MRLGDGHDEDHTGEQATVCSWKHSRFPPASPAWSLTTTTYNGEGVTKLLILPLPASAALGRFKD